MIRVLHVLEPEPEGEVGGADLHVLDLATAQRARKEVDPYVVINQSSGFAARLAERGIAFFPGHLRRGKLFRLAMRLADLPRFKRIDIVHGHGYESNYIISILNMLFPFSWGKLPVVMTCHGWVETQRRLRLKTTLDLWTYRFAKVLIICARNQSLRLAQRVPRKHVAYIPNGVILPTSAEQTTQISHLSALRAGGNKIAGFVGRLAQEKHVDLIIKIFSLVAAVVPDSHLVIIGSGPERESLERQSRALGLTRRVHFLGYVRHVGPLYPFLDVLVQSSETESTSRVIAEGMLSGVPVVASRVGGLPDMINDGQDGFLCPFGDIELYKQVVARLLQNPELRSDVGLAAKLRASREFTVDTMERAVATVYRHVLRSKASSWSPSNL